ncbi:MAG TPA: S24 family peptidase [Alphaproteobacteria bacterium]|nr:S24 family peptidase [Alphaproteobacteria bacterium]
MGEQGSQERVRKLVRSRVAELRLSLSEVSAKLGRNHAYLQQFLERGIPRTLPEAVRPALAAILQVDESALRGETLAGAPPQPRPPLQTPPESALELPVYASAQGGSDGMSVTPEPIDWVPRPRPLQHVAKAYAVYVVGDSMDPAYRHGDMAFVHPSLPLLRGSDVMLLREENGQMMAMVKQLVSWNERHWRVKQFNPEREFQLNRQQWQQANVIVAKYNRR